MDDDYISILAGRLRGKRAWPPVRTYGSMFILDIGKSVSRPGYQKPHGEWMLVVEQAQWRLNKGGLVLGSECTRPELIDKIFDNVKPGKILDFQINATTQAIVVKIGNLFILEISYNSSSEAKGEDQWLLYEPAGVVLIAKDKEIRLEGAARLT